jgi:preprotein translocase subunit SecD
MERRPRQDTMDFNEIKRVHMRGISHSRFDNLTYSDLVKRKTDEVLNEQVSGAKDIEVNLPEIKDQRAKKSARRKHDMDFKQRNKQTLSGKSPNLRHDDRTNPYLNLNKFLARTDNPDHDKAIYQRKEFKYVEST